MIRFNYLWCSIALYIKVFCNIHRLSLLCLIVGKGLRIMGLIHAASFTSKVKTKHTKFTWCQLTYFALIIFNKRKIYWKASLRVNYLCKLLHFLVKNIFLNQISNSKFAGNQNFYLSIFLLLSSFLIFSKYIGFKLDFWKEGC